MSVRKQASVLRIPRIKLTKMSNLDISSKKVVLLTGATGKFGSTFISRYQDQFKIIGIARKSPSQAPRNWTFLEGDVAANATTLIAQALAVHGKIDCLINAAVYSNWVAFPDMTGNDFAQHMAVNVNAPYNLSHALMDQYWIKEAFKTNTEVNRSILNISSIAGSKLFAGRGRGAYSSSKSALNMISRHLAHDIRGHGIRVNALAPNTFPGWLSTEEVCEAAKSLIESRDNGCVRVLDKDLQYDEK